MPLKALLRKILDFPLTQLLLGFSAIILTTSVIQLLVGLLSLPKEGAVEVLVGALLALVAVLGYRFYVRVIERRDPAEVARAGALRGVAQGLLLGVVLFSVTIGIISLLSAGQIARYNAWTVLFASLAMAITSSVFEELLLRALIFRITERWLGSWLSLGASAALFGAMHLSNEHATTTAAIAIALEAGILLGAAYMATRSLWLPIGIHAGWNFTQGGIFGVAVSGHSSEGLMEITLSGPELITGGDFGAEASVVAVVVCLIAAVGLLYKARRGGNLLAPFWKRARRPSTT